jgi:2-polyprenyl-3-methyl-5-hydroxy-6-metoxy-1,4-benzoquinol methylase
MEDFNLLAQTWDNEPRRIERAKIITQEILSEIPGSDKRTGMEFGCGTGLLSFSLQPHFRHITLVDSSEGMISVVREKIQKAQIDNMTPLCLDLFNDKIHQKFDVIYALLGLHHVPDTDRILEIFWEMINPSGYLCIVDLDEEDGSFHGPGFDGHNGFNRDNLIGKLQHLGFTDIKWRICYQNKKTFADGSIRYYPVFLLTGKK